MRPRYEIVTIVSLLAGCTDGAPAGPTPGRPSFDGIAAYELVGAQLAFGPRVPGTDGHARQLDWMLARLDSLAPVVEADSFQYVTTYGDSLDLVNVMARFEPQETRRILLLAHWDTRPTSDLSVDPTDRATPVPGANDGGSATAVLLQMAELLATDVPPMGVDLLFVDGEDYGPTVDDMLIGSRHFADNLPSDNRPIYGVLLDMVGDADPSFPVEAYSAQFAQVVVQKVWRAADRLGYGGYFPNTVGQPIIDDHIPLNQAGLPTANVIDFTYGPNNAYWHTPNDVIEHVSATTLTMVGEVIAELIYSGG